jgi:hypothetical protein
MKIMRWTMMLCQAVKDSTKSSILHSKMSWQWNVHGTKLTWNVHVGIVQNTALSFVQVHDWHSTWMLCCLEQFWFLPRQILDDDMTFHCANRRKVRANDTHLLFRKNHQEQRRKMQHLCYDHLIKSAVINFPSLEGKHPLGLFWSLIPLFVPFFYHF